MKVREIVDIIQKDGWYLVAIRGSHHQYRHLTKSGRVTVPGTPGKDLPRGTERSILKQARLDHER
jgi:predicted RNA binding protein YcfA (HicA-like mRNA interferase family)